MDYLTLKIIHLAGLGLTFMGLSGVLGVQLMGGAPFKKRVVFHAAHDLGLLLVMATGIALLAQLQGGHLHAPPGWVKAKFGIWILAGGSMFLAARYGRYAGWILLFFTGLVIGAAWLAINKPF